MKNRISPFWFLCVMVIGALVLLFAGGSSKGETKSERAAPSPSVVLPPDKPQPLTGLLRKIADLEKSRTELLKQAVGDDPEGRTLLAFHEQHAIYGKIVGYKDIFVFKTRLAASAPKSKAAIRGYVVAVADQETRIAAGYDVAASFEYDGKGNTMFLPLKDYYTPLWYGVIMAHETRHAYDVNTGIEKAGATGMEWAKGEFRAYTLEHRLLDQATHGAWTREVEKIVDQLGALTEKKDGFAFWPKKDSLHKLDAVFPLPVSADEEDLRTMSMIFAVNFRHADRNKLHDEVKLRMILQVREEQMRDNKP